MIRFMGEGEGGPTEVDVVQVKVLKTPPFE